ncbi:MAG: glycosyltransferase family 4 protein [Thermoguttaceae bacterium]|nr:glycosyltransferase family 4 protein [Thermoguttaceae bacterium]MDW8079178.1 glycosyltransferase family 4 protein [Thermoguttaceae bacterium]
MAAFLKTERLLLPAVDETNCPQFGLYVFGYPAEIGGASTELWHTLRLWRLMGLSVSCVVSAPPPARWQGKVNKLGVRTLIWRHSVLDEYPEIRGRTAIAFCHREFLQLAPVLRQAGCRLLWAGCMNWLFPAELRFYRQHGPMDGYLFQSRFQLRTLLPQLAAWGVDRTRCHHIPGAFFVDEMPFCFLPRRPDEPLVVGRLCRPDPAKWPQELWTTLAQTRLALRCRLMGWSPRIAQHVGPPPPWAEVFPPGAIPAQQFYASLHVLLGWGGSAIENWPRIALEAMAAGVPIVAPASGGWPEMIDHGRTGLLFRTTAELVDCLRQLVDEELRLYLASQARRHVEEVLAPAQKLIPRWQTFLGVNNWRSLSDES